MSWYYEKRKTYGFLALEFSNLYKNIYISYRSQELKRWYMCLLTLDFHKWNTDKNQLFISKLMCKWKKTRKVIGKNPTFFCISLSMKVSRKDLRWSFFIRLLLAISIDISIKLSNSSARETLFLSETSTAGPPILEATCVVFLQLEASKTSSSAQISNWKKKIKKMMKKYVLSSLI